MSLIAVESREGRLAFENATRVGVVAALSATTMLFGSLASAYLVRRSFADWRPEFASWPLLLLTFASLTSLGMEAASRSQGAWRRRAFLAVLGASAAYLLGACAVISSTFTSRGALASPHLAFVALLLSLHVGHAVLGASFTIWILHPNQAASPARLFLARLVTHFLTALLFAIVLLLFGLP